MKEEVRVANGVGSEDAVSILHVKVAKHHQTLTLDAVSLFQTCDFTGDFDTSHEYLAICDWSAWQRGKQGNHDDPPE